DLLALERNAYRLDRRVERLRILLERFQRAGIRLLLARRELLAGPARDVEGVPGVEVVAAREIALADPAPRRCPVVGLEAREPRHRLARILGLDAGERHDVALRAAHGLLLELLERARAPALRGGYE